jgi:integrase
MEMSGEHLVTEVLGKMRDAGYTESTLDAFRVLYKHLLRFMAENGIGEYTPETGQAALSVMRAARNCEKNRRQCNVVIRHLDNYLAGKPFETPLGQRRRAPISIYPEFDDYLEWCAVRGLAQSTINKHHDIVKRIADGLCALNVESVASLGMRAVVDYCKSLSGLSLARKHDFALILKALLRFLHEHGHIATDLSQSVLSVRYSSDSRIPSYYSQDEVTRLLGAIGTKTPMQKRAYAAALIAARTGMRRSDIAGLKFSSIDWENDKIELIQQKTKVPLYLPLLPEVGEAIADYLLNGRPLGDSDYIFLNHMPPFDPMQPSSLNYIVSTALDKAGIDVNFRKMGPHALRFSLASRMLERGETVKTIADALGHQNIQTTTVYARIDTPSLSQCALPVPMYRELNDFVIDERLETPVVGDLAGHIVDFITYKRSMSQKAVNDLKHLSNLARFSLSFDLSDSLLPREMSEKWLAKRDDEKPKSQCERHSTFVHFATYLANLGHPVFVPEPLRNRSRSKFSPHIFSDDELSKFFAAADSYELGPSSVVAASRALPATLFRLLLGCGIRVSEALSLKHSDVGLADRTLRILQAKNNKARIVVMGESLCSIMASHIEARVGTADQLVFAKDSGERIAPELAYVWFRKILVRANIPHRGKDFGPRVHDFRHTFAVRSLNRMLLDGKPLYSALPILKDYLGHSRISDTERYVRIVEWMFPDVIDAMNSISAQIIPDWGAGR